MTIGLQDDSLILHWEGMDFHRAYLADAPRNECYATALNRHAADRLVVDVGSGTGILAMMAARAGAASVIGVEWSSLAQTAARAVTANGLGNVVRIFQEDARNFVPQRRADLVVHDLIGSFVWDEDVLDVMRHVRECVLAPRGRIIPCAVELHIVPITWPERMHLRRFWARRHAGLDFSAFAERDKCCGPASGPTVVHLDATDCFIANPDHAMTTDFSEAFVLPSTISRRFRIRRDDMIDALLGYLEIHFDEQTSLCTAPGRAATNWGQVVVPLGEPLPVRSGEDVNVTFMPALRSSQWEVAITVH